MTSSLGISLSAAVPLWIESFVQAGYSFADVTKIASEASQIIAEKGDLILFKSKKKGETANAFNALAKGIAALAFVPGGCTTFGQHFEADPKRLRSA